jgi:hypothetical protein
VVFTPQVVGTTSAPQQFVIRNTGNVPLIFHTGGITGPGFDAGPGPSTCRTAQIPPGGTCTGTVVFRPAAPGTAQGAVTVSSNAPDGTTRLPLTGTGVVAGPRLVFEPSGLAFGSQALGTTSRPQQVVIRNTGNAPLTLQGVAVDGRGFETGPGTTTCRGTPIAPGGSCTWSVVFRPVSVGAARAEVVVSSNAPGGVSRLPLTRTGTRGR